MASEAQNTQPVLSEIEGYAILRSLPPMLAHLLFCRGQYAIRASALYICREPSTNHLLFMQNKPNFRKAKK